MRMFETVIQYLYWKITACCKIAVLKHAIKSNTCPKHGETLLYCSSAIQSTRASCLAPFHTWVMGGERRGIKLSFLHPTLPCTKQCVCIIIHTALGEYHTITKTGIKTPLACVCQSSFSQTNQENPHYSVMMWITI